MLPTALCAAQLELLTLPNWSRIPVGETALIEGGAVVARVNGPAAVFNNPAGLARLDFPSISGSFSALEYNRVGSRSENGNAQADSAALKPNLVGFATAWDEADADGGGWGFALASPISWSSALRVDATTSTGSRQDNGRSSLEALVPTIGFGTPLSDTIAIGWAIEAWLIEYRLDNGSSAQDGTTLYTSTYTESGRQLSLRLTVGAQWEFPGWNLGVQVRSPGIHLANQGEIASASTSGDGTTSTLTAVRDQRAGFSMPLPASICFGVAWRPADIHGLELEGNLALYGGGTSVPVFRSTNGTTTTVTAGPTTTYTPFELPERRFDPRFVINPRFGLAYRLHQPLWNRIAVLHLGGYLDHSPVSSSDVFTRLNLLGGTAGLSLERGPMRLTLGAVYVTSSSLTEALNYVTAPSSGLQPSLADPNATFAVRSFILGIGTSYRF